MSPIELSLRHFRRLGFVAEKVERWNGFAMRRQDLFGFGDILAMRAGFPHLLVQATTCSNISARLKKARALPQREVLEVWIASGGAVVIQGWRKFGQRGGRKLWTLREVWISTISELVEG